MQSSVGARERSVLWLTISGCVSRRWLRCTAASLLLSSAPLAQVQFEERGIKGYLPARNDATEALALGDLDGDGDLDLVKGGRLTSTLAEPNTLLLNDGAGRFVDAGPGRLPGEGCEDLVVADVDGDADLDVIAASPDGAFLYENDGAATFADATSGKLPPSVGGFYALELGDVDADGDLDLFLSPLNGQDRLYLNDGSGAFADVTAARLPAASTHTGDFGLGDVDGDLDLDLVLAERSIFQNRLYLNDGFGTFTDATAVSLPSDASNDQAVALGDVDADGDLDLLFACFTCRSKLYLNDGAGVFADAPSQVPAITSWAYAVLLEDVDDDADPDLVVANGFYSATPRNRLHLNDGLGNFTVPGGELPPDFDDTRCLAPGDVDGDGDLDLVFGNAASGGEQDRVFLNDGEAHFVNGSRLRLPEPIYAPASTAVATDTDGDGDLDLLLGTGTDSFECGFAPCGFPVVQYENDGRGVFGDATAARMPALPDNAATLAAGDVNHDGAPDLFVGNANAHYSCPISGGCVAREPHRLYMNDGDGAFADASSRLPSLPAFTPSAALFADVEDDGDLDLLVAFPIQQKRLYLNEGAGVFNDATASRLPIEQDFTHALALLDAEADGDLDLVLGNQIDPSRLYHNDGTGRYTKAPGGRFPQQNRETRALGVGDFDLDGDADVVLGNAQRPGLFLNDGAGTFADESARMPAHPSYSVAVAIADVDEDGDPDIALGLGALFSQPSQKDRLYLGDGTAHFTDATARIAQRDGKTRELLFADVDADGDEDLYVAREGEERLYSNLHRQLGAPFFPIVGRSYALEFDAAPGYAAAPHAAVAALSAELAAAPFTLPPLVGKLWLVPPWTLLPPVAIPAPGGQAGLAQTIPPDPALLGTLFYVQSAFVGGTQHLRLTNYVKDQIRF